MSAEVIATLSPWLDAAADLALAVATPNAQLQLLRLADQHKELSEVAYQRAKELKDESAVAALAAAYYERRAQVCV
jgi:hypothetical protein